MGAEEWKAEGFSMLKEVSFQGVASRQDSSADGAVNQYKQRDLSQTFFFKMAAKTFGLPKSRHRIMVAPLMEKPTSKGVEITQAPEANHRRQREAPTRVSEAPTEKEPSWRPQTELVGGHGNDVRDYHKWISERKKFRTQLENFGNVNKWLKRKPVLTELESKVLEKLDERQLRGVPGPEEDFASPPPRSSRGCSVTPSIHRPCPEALSVLDRYLQDNRLRLVDLYNRTDKVKKKKISRSDLKAVRKEANIPLNDSQLEDLLIFLGSKDANSINYKELAKGRRLWKHKVLEEPQKRMKSKPGTSGAPLSPGVQEVTSEIIRRPGSEPPKSAYSSQDQSGALSLLSPEPYSSRSSARRSVLLEVPPINLEEGRPLSYEDMEEIGKIYRERRRLRKSNSRLLDWVDQCRMVRSGNRVIDQHCLPSTLAPESSNLVDRYRRACLLEYTKILQLCHKYNIPLSEHLLENALLYPGDKIIVDSGHLLKLRQPGTSHLHPTAETSRFFPDTRTSHVYPAAGTSHFTPGAGMSNLSPGAGTSHLSPGQDTSHLYPAAGTSHLSPGAGMSRLSHGARGTPLSSGEGTSPSISSDFRKHPTKGLSEDQSRLRAGDEESGHDEDPEFSSPPYPPRRYVRMVKARVRGRHPAEPSMMNCWTTFEQYQQMTRNLKRKFPHLCPIPDTNAFWPGRLLDKVRLYLPHATRRPEEALFCYVKPTKASYPRICTNEKSWPVSDQGYVTSGDACIRQNVF